MEQSKHIGRNQNTEATTHTELHTLKSRLHTAKKKQKKKEFLIQMDHTRNKTIITSIFFLISKGIVLKNHQSNGLKSTRKKNTPHTLAELSFPYICFLFIGHFLICYTQKSGNHIRKDSKRVLWRNHLRGSKFASSD